VKPVAPCTTMSNSLVILKVFLKDAKH